MSAVKVKTFDSPPGELMTWIGLYAIYKEPRDEIDVYVVYLETMGTQVYAYKYISEHTTQDGARAEIEALRRK